MRKGGMLEPRRLRKVAKVVRPAAPAPKKAAPRPVAVAGRETGRPLAPPKPTPAAKKLSSLAGKPRRRKY